MSIYIRLLGTFWNHRKTAMLRGLIGDDALWVVPRLWSYAAQHQPDGDFSKYNDATLRAVLECHKNPSSILQALLDAGFMDADMNIHGWNEHNGYHSVFASRAKKGAEARWSGLRKKKRIQREKDRDKDRDKDKDKDKETSIATSNASSIPSQLSSIHGFAEEWNAWMEVRKQKKATPTPHAMDLLYRKFATRPKDAVKGVQMAITRNWTGFEWSWFDKDASPTNRTPVPIYRDPKVDLVAKRMKEDAEFDRNESLRQQKAGAA